jgi:uncharacterized small protein (DUF1192 family)
MISSPKEELREQAMDMDELEPRRKPAQQKLLDPLSVGELEEYIADLEAEIARARAAIKAKQAHRAGIDGLFKT